MTAMVPTATATPEPTATATATDTPTLTAVPTSTHTPGPTVTPPPSIEAEEYAVYSAAVRQNPISYDFGPFLVIRDQTSTFDDRLFEQTLAVHSLPADLADSYRSRNSASYTLGPNLELEQDYVLMTQKEYEQLFGRRGGGWPEFESTYPGAEGLINFSRVGFSEDGGTALVEMGFRCWDLCGAGGLYLFTKEGDEWVFEKELMVWMS